MREMLLGVHLSGLLACLVTCAVALLTSGCQSGRSTSALFLDTAFPSGRSHQELSVGDRTFEVFVYRPATYQGERMFLVMHGSLCNADEYRDHAIPMGDRFGALIVAPRFEDGPLTSQTYLQGGVQVVDGIVPPSSEWPCRWIPELADLVRSREGRPDLSYWLIGHSAGGQFIARMSAFLDVGAERLVAANPATLLFPTREAPFPFGFGQLPAVWSDDLALRRYLAAPLSLYLGGDDIESVALISNELSMHQGAHRLDRGRKCFELARRLAEERGWPFHWRLVIAGGVGHDAGEMFRHKRAEDALLLLPEPGN